MKNLKNLSRYLLPLAIIIFFVLRLPQVLRNEFPFVFDMGRDHIWVRNMVELKRPTLIGPWGSLAGIYFGPAWYYLLSIPYIFSGGLPQASVIWVAALNLLALWLGYNFLKKTINLKTALIFAFVFALSPHNINITTYPFHANVMTLTQIIILVSLLNYKLWPAALASSLNFHFEPAAGIFTTLTLLLWIIWQRKQLDLRSIRPVRSIAAFTAPFVPQIIFELRHNFIQTKSLFLYFQGQNQSLEGRLPFSTRILERFQKFTQLFQASVFDHPNILLAGLMLVLLIAYLLTVKKTKKQTTLLNLSLFTLLIPLLGFMFLFPPELKGWYLYGFSINYFILVAMFFSLISIKNITHYFLLIIFYLFWLSGIYKPRLSLSGPESLKSQLQVIDKIYQLAENKPFSAYVYTPPIYDYQFQYLFWLKSRQANLSLPVEYSYLPGETSYHPQKQYFVSTLDQSPQNIFLIIEPEKDLGRLNGWLGHFSNYQKLSEITLPSGYIIQTLKAPI